MQIRTLQGLSRCRAPEFFSVWRLRLSSLARGCFCNLLVQMLLGLARAVILGSKSCRTHDHILLSHLRLSQLWGPGHRIYIPQEQNGPDIPPGTRFPFCRLLRLAGLWRRHSNPPPRESDSDSRSRSYFTTDGQSGRQYVLLSSPLWDLWPDITFLSEGCCL
jgi:hypothetical protein